MGLWNWLLNGWKAAIPTAGEAPPRPRGKSRRLVLESLEPRRLLSGNPPLDPAFAAMLANVTPTPHRPATNPPTRPR